jgi:hypoxanthine phosphoribosyltransferase
MNPENPDSRLRARPVPPHLIPFAGADEVRRRVGVLGAEIGEWAREVTAGSGRQPLALCILRGGVFFFSDLLLACPVSVEPAFCRCRAYRQNHNGVAAEHVEIAMDAPAVEGRHVLVVDDICDSGRTLAAVAARIRELGALEVEAAVCVHRSRADGAYGPRWRAFEHDGPEWFAGYGMEDASHFMNYPGLYLLKGG